LFLEGITVRSRGRLPHWEKKEGIYFVTYRLADSIPRSLIEYIKGEREDIVKTARQLNCELSKDAIKRLNELSNQKIEQYLDSGAGACYMNDPKIAKINADTLLFYHNHHYILFSYCIMPNHIHVVFQPIGSYTLAIILKSWKTFTSLNANRILGRKGRFWQKEYYDHLIRNENELAQTIQYVLKNPIKAGLKNWEWVWVNEEFWIISKNE